MTHPCHQQTGNRPAGVYAILLLALTITGCSTALLNTQLSETPSKSPYDFESRLPDNDDRLFVVLAFSGGGTRAAALSYGVLDALRREQIVIGDRQQRLLDQVDVISAVSGGSYTAAYYGLFGDRLFADFQQRFLLRNWPRTYGWMLANPVNMAKLASPDFNRSDLMARFLDEQIFAGKTFADLSLDRLPFVIINATDINNSLTFSFIQQQFDLLCSDLDSYPISRAVMASSMVPPAFAPLRLRNYSGCRAKTKPWINAALQARNLLSREFAVAQGVSRYFEKEDMPYLNLADGGITDNIGVRGSMMSPIAHRGNVEKMTGAFNREAMSKVEQVLVVLVNAQVYPPYPWAVAGNEPGTIETMEASFDAAFNTLTTENIAQARREFMAWGASITAQRAPEQPEVSVHFATLTFNQVKDAARRAKYNSLPTAALDGSQVESLTALGAELLEQSGTYRQFLENLAQLGSRSLKTDTQP